MTGLFKKAAAFTDIHFGKSNDSRVHNQDCEDFIIWFIKEAKKHNCETCIFLGDWSHNR
jgi:DNA repair exonuclease SbcCD nuclease subunit